MRNRRLVLVAAGLLALALGPAAEAATVTRGPYLQQGTPNSLVIRWRTDSNTDSRVLYGNSPGSLLDSVVVSGSTNKHEVKLTGLAPATTYFYAIGSSSQILAGDDTDHFFVTSPVAGSNGPLRVWVIGDSGSGGSRARSVRDAFLGYHGSSHVDAWLMLGDNAYNDGTDSEYQDAVFDMYPTILRQTMLWPTIGNHDARSANSDQQSGVYYDIFTLPKNAQAGGLASGTEAYYSYDVGNVHFICLDSQETDPSSSGPMMTWLDEDLAATTQQWIIAYWHHPPYSKGSHDSDSESPLRDMRENALPILESHGVDMVLSGHSHSYERSFFIDGHYGNSGSFDQATMMVDRGDGRIDGDGAYQKNSRGAVYIVAGSSGKTGGGSLDHRVMYIGLDQLGSVVLDFTSSQLDSTFIDSAGVIQDYVTITKGPPPNQPPVVDAGPDQGIVLPSSASLNGTVTDDGLPDPPNALTFTGSQVSGPGTTTFANPAAEDTTATFSAPGSYLLRLTADDSELQDSAEVTVVVYPAGTVNQPPQVSATTPTPTVRQPGPATLDGSVSDDGLPNPPGVVTQSWTKTSGPGTVTFANPAAVDTTATFSAIGSYVLRLTASDSQATAFAEVAVTVATTLPQSIEVRVAGGSDDAEEKPTGGIPYITSSDLEMVDDVGDIQTVGMRFTGVDIPQGATIVDAWIQFQVDEATSQATSVTIEGQASDNAATFTTSSGSISSRPRTSAAVAVPWSLPAWNQIGAAGTDQQTPNLAGIIQEIVSRPAWTSGNALVIIVTGSGRRVAESYEGDTGGAPLLHIDIDAGPPPIDWIFIDGFESGDSTVWSSRFPDTPN